MRLDRASVMKNSFSRKVCRTGFLRRVEPPQRDRLAVMSDVGGEFIARLVERSAKRQFRAPIFPSAPLVLGVYFSVDIPKIGDSVVAPITVDVVYFMSWQDAEHVEPGQMVSQVFVAADTDLPVAMEISPASQLPRSGPPGSPDEFPCVLVVHQHIMKHLAREIGSAIDGCKRTGFCVIEAFIPLEPATNGGLGSLAHFRQRCDRPTVPVHFLHQRNPRLTFRGSA